MRGKFLAPSETNVAHSQAQDVAPSETSIALSETNVAWSQTQDVAPSETSIALSETIVARNQTQDLALSETIVARNQTQDVDPGETNVAWRQAQDLALSETNVALSETNVALSETNVALSETNVAQRQAQDVAPSETSVALSRTQDVAPSETSVALSRTQNVAPSETNVALSETQDVAPSGTNVAQNQTQDVALSEMEGTATKQTKVVALDEKGVHLGEAEFVNLSEAEVLAMRESGTVVLSESEPIALSETEAVVLSETVAVALNERTDEALSETTDVALNDVEVCDKNIKGKICDERRPKCRPKRPCLFCGKFLADITRHLLHCHSDEERIKSILLREERAELSHKDVLLEINSMRKEGILKFNKMQLLKNPQVDLICERKSNGKKVMCSMCQGLFRSKYFYRHQKNCRTKYGKRERAIKVNLVTSRETLTNCSKEWYQIMQSMKKDKYFEILANDEHIPRIGEHYYARKKPSKIREAKQKAMSQMRKLARLLDHCKGLDKSEEIFKASNFYVVEQAIKEMCFTEEREKPGLKAAMASLLKTSCDILMSHFIFIEQKHKAEEVQLFKQVLSTNYAKIFSSAEHKLKEKRLQETSRPVVLPNEEDLEHLRVTLDRKIQEIKSINNVYEFVRARQLVLVRLTILNTRLGSDPTNLTISDYLQRDQWIDRKNLNNQQKELQKRYSITYIMGKGNRMVPVIFPRQCEKLLDLLVDPEVRRMAGVASSNHFLFCYTRDSPYGSVVGYSELNRVCSSIGLKTFTMTTTKMRHRVSVYFWKREHFSEREVDTFLEHVGRPELTDQIIYQVPPALATMTTLAPIIEDLEQVVSEPSHSEDDSDLTDVDRDVTVPGKKRKSKRIHSKIACKCQEDDGILSDEDRVTVDSKKRRRIRSERTYVRWSVEDTNKVQTYFSKYIQDEKLKCYPGEQEIQEFKKLMHVNHPWQTIKTKVFNEKKTLKQRQVASEPSHSEDDGNLTDVDRGVTVPGKKRRSKRIRLEIASKCQEDDDNLTDVDRGVTVADKTRKSKRIPSEIASKCQEDDGIPTDEECGVSVPGKTRKSKRIRLEIASKCQEDDGILTDEDRGVTVDSKKMKTIPSERSYVRWSVEDTNKVQTYFSKYIQDEKMKCYPGKQEIEEFKKVTHVDHPWQTIKTKVFNEKKTLRLKQHLV